MAGPKKSVALSGVSVAETSICSIDPDEGVLMYRGYDIAELAEHASYEEVAYLLLEGELPSSDELESFAEQLAAARELPAAVATIVDGNAMDASPMETLRTAVSALSFSDPAEDAIDRESEHRKAVALIAQLPTIVARYERRRRGEPAVAPDPTLGYAESFLTMLRGEAPTASEARAFEVAMILHAEHEMNASTFTARVVAGTNADMHSAIVGAICALKGPLHGGANQAAMAMFDEFGSADRVAEGVRGRLVEKKPLYGFGHPLYRAMDPRAPILRRLSEEFSRRRRARLPRDRAHGRARGVRAEGALAERRPLLGRPLPRPRDPDRPLHPALRDEPRRRAGGARARAACGREDHPPERRVRRRATARLPRARAAGRAMNDFKPGLEGVVAFETEIAEPDREGGALRYRGVDIEELVGSHRFEQVWGLLVDESFEPGLPAVDPYEGGGLTGNTPADLQAVTARLGGEWGLKKLIDITDDEAREDLRRVSAQFISIAAQSARLADGNDDRIAPQAIAQGKTTAERFLLEWRGEADPKHVQALDTYWICTCEHGLNASTFVARITASTAVRLCRGAFSHRRSAPSRARCTAAHPRACCRCSTRSPSPAIAESYVNGADRARRTADGLRPPRLPRRGPARSPAQGHGEGARRTALRRGRGARAGRPRRAPASARRTGRWRRTSSSGRPSCSTSPTCRRRSRRPCSPARGRPAGRPTSSSRRS